MCIEMSMLCVRVYILLLLPLYVGVSVNGLVLLMTVTVSYVS